MYRPGSGAKRHSIHGEVGYGAPVGARRRTHHRSRSLFLWLVVEQGAENDSKRTREREESMWLWSSQPRAGGQREQKGPAAPFLENPTEMRAERAWGQGFGDSLSIAPTPARSLHRISNFDHSHTAGTTVVYWGGKRDDSGCPSSAQRLACTIARMPARTAGGRLDHASTT